MENKISTLKELEEIEKKYDPQLSFREIGSKLNFIIFILFFFSIFFLNAIISLNFHFVSICKRGKGIGEG